MIFFSCNLPSINSLKCISINNQECKEDQKMLMLILMSLYFILFILKQVNAVVVVIISEIHMQ